MGEKAAIRILSRVHDKSLAAPSEDLRAADRYCPTTRTENVPGSAGALGFGFSGVGEGRGPKSETGKYTVPVLWSRAMVLAPGNVFTFCTSVYLSGLSS